MPARRKPRPKPKAAAKGLAGYLDEQIDQLKRSLPKAIRHGRPKPVHKARVAARRLSALIDVLEPLIAKKHAKRVRRFAKEVRAALGELRDADAMRETLQRSRPTGILAATLDAELERHRSKAEKRCRKRLKECDLGNLRREAKRFIKHVIAEAVATALRETAYAALDAIVDAVAESTIRSRNLHPARVAAKRLRYALEVAALLDVAMAPALLARVRAVQDRLGAWHDATVLAAFVLSGASTTEKLESDTVQAAERVRFAERVTETAARHSEAFVSQWQRSGTALARAVRRALPLAVS